MSSHKHIITLTLIFVAVFFGGCKNSVEYINVYQTCNCPDPIQNENGIRIPAKYYSGGLSWDNSVLTISLNGSREKLQFFNLQTHSFQNIYMNQLFPDTGDYRKQILRTFLWCPYNANKFYIETIGFYDTTGQRKQFIYDMVNSYIVDIEKNSVIRVTPKKYGKYGSRLGCGFGNWLKGSHEGLDSFYNVGQIYVPQEDKYYTAPPEYTYNNTDYFSQSPNTSHNIYSGYDGSNLIWLLDNKQVYSAQEMTHAIVASFSWSPTGDKVAIDGYPNFPNTDTVNHPSFEEVWILDAKHLLTTGEEIVTRLNFQKLFCTYSARGIGAQYLTDSTLIVSMHKDGDAISPLWEITDKGKIVRQLYP